MGLRANAFSEATVIQYDTSYICLLCMYDIRKRERKGNILETSGNGSLMNQFIKKDNLKNWETSSEPILCIFVEMYMVQVYSSAEFPFLFVLHKYICNESSCKEIKQPQGKECLHVP